MINNYMKYTIYQVTNTVNNKVYVGKHQTLNINDSYYGSGVAIVSAIKKYGKGNFVKEVLFVFDSEDEMNQKEREIITEEFVKRKDTYNLGIGGEGGPHFKGKTHSKQSIEKIKRNSKAAVHTAETRKKISESNRTREISAETKRKISIKAFLRNGKTLEEASKILDSRKLKNKKTKSKAMKDYHNNLDNPIRKIDKECNLSEIKKDYDLGTKPKDIMKKHSLTKNRYDHIRSYYLK